MKRSAPVSLIDARLLGRWPLPTLPPGADKQQRGDVLIVGGSRAVPGAVLLAGEAALRAGAGRVMLGTVRPAALLLALAFPEARVVALPQTRGGDLGKGSVQSLTTGLQRCTAVLLGPGMLASAAIAPIVSRLRRARHACTLVADAGALPLLRGRRPFARAALRGVIATPHAGEMAELWGCSREEVASAPLELAREAARALDVVLVLKGEQTFVVDPDGRAYRNTAGNAGLATAGSGDTLSGIITGLAARGADPAQAAVWGVHLHALAGEALARRHGPLGYLARELSCEVPRLLARLARR